MFVLWCYGSKFMPAVLIVLLSYGAMLRSFCNQIVANNNGTRCLMVYPSPIIDFNGNESLFYNSSSKHYFDKEWRGWTDVYEEGYIMSQQISLFILFIFIG